MELLYNISVKPIVESFRSPVRTVWGVAGYCPELLTITEQHFRCLWPQTVKAYNWYPCFGEICADGSFKGKRLAGKIANCSPDK